MSLHDIWVFAAASWAIALLFGALIWVVTHWKAKQLKQDSKLPRRLAGTGAIRLEPKRKRRGA